MRAETDFHREPRAGDVMALEWTVAKLGDKTVTFQHRLMNVVTGDAVMSAEFKCVLLDIEKRQETRDGNTGRHSSKGGRIDRGAALISAWRIGMQDLKAFFDAYRDSFPKGPAAIAAFYSEPCVTARAGIVRVHSSSSDITSLFADVDKQYRDRGYTHADCVSFDCRSLGANSALATVRWAYKGPHEQTIWETTFSYNVYRRDGVWKILVQTMHDQREQV